MSRPLYKNKKKKKNKRRKGTKNKEKKQRYPPLSTFSNKPKTGRQKPFAKLRIRNNHNTDQKPITQQMARAILSPM